MNILSKFGGTSLATFESLKKVKKITEDNPYRNIIIVSAPGKINEDDIKITDLLIKLSKTKDESLIEKIVEKYQKFDIGNTNFIRDEIKKKIKI